MFIKFFTSLNFMKTSSAPIEITTMTTYLTWKEMYQRAYDPKYMDLGSAGRNAALALRQFDLQGEQHPHIRQVSHSPLERAFFAMGDEASRVNTKLWNFTGNKRKQKFPLETMAAGALGGFAATAAALYKLL